MNVCMILPTKDFPPDIRVEKEARALQGAGHRVFVLCDQVKRKPPIEVWEGITIMRRKRIPVPTLVEKFNGIPGWNGFLDWQWCGFIDRVIRSKRIDVLHIHDLPKAGAAIAAGHRHAIPVIMDLHENFPGSMKTYVEGMCGWQRWAARILIDSHKWRQYEQKQTTKADRIIVVVSEAGERLKTAGIAADKITVIENTEPIDGSSSPVLDNTIVDEFQNDFMLLYLGGFGGKANHRGLMTAVDAMPRVLKSIPHARLALVGKGSIKPILVEMVNDRNLGNNVTIIDWVPFEKVHSYIAASSVCLLPYSSTPNTEASSPNKLFQYMYMCKPVVVSSCKSLKRYMEETGGGIVFRAGDSADLSRAIVQLKDEAIRTELGKKGRSAVLNKYNWDVTSEKLISLYKKFSGQPV